MLSWTAELEISVSLLGMYLGRLVFRLKLPVTGTLNPNSGKKCSILVFALTDTASVVVPVPRLCPNGV
jgi:hypothetical protein